jgi:hypothetical protein
VSVAQELQTSKPFLHQIDRFSEIREQRIKLIAIFARCLDISDKEKHEKFSSKLLIANI